MCRVRLDRGSDGGTARLEILASLTQVNLEQAVVITVAAAITVTIMTRFGLPVSTSQASVGAILGIGFFNKEIDLEGLGKVVLCWFGTPVGAVLVCAILYKLLSVIYNRLPVSVFRADAGLE